MFLFKMHLTAVVIISILNFNIDSVDKLTNIRKHTNLKTNLIFQENIIDELS